MVRFCPNRLEERASRHLLPGLRQSSAHAKGSTKLVRPWPMDLRTPLPRRVAHTEPEVVVAPFEGIHVSFTDDTGATLSSGPVSSLR
jgi:hypothetical protein